MKLKLWVVQARLRAPLASAHGTAGVRPLVQVSLTDDDGLTGYGEAAPLESYDGVSVDQVLAALEAWRPGEPDPALPQAAAALDLARWDLAGKRAGQPVWRLLGGSQPPLVRLNATIGAEAPAPAAAQATRARAAGFTCVKVKVGTPDDVARVSAVREAVPDIEIRLDANGAWSVGEAVAMLGRLAPLGIELCEEPVHGEAALAQVAEAVAVPVAADETRVLDRRVCASVCLKIGASGGITGVRRDAERARRLGYRVYLASTLDGPLGIAAALHSAAVVRPDLPCGLATLGRFDFPDPLMAEEGSMRAPSEPGIGLPPVFVNADVH
ncbi:MAG TPA: enolase C-terminal domain-like protein [Solirubrobacteraceae bacterium]|nr:enolase C-terminal domain-like protein [Solirubrobacteraceae bacterium]